MKDVLKLMLPGAAAAAFAVASGVSKGIDPVAIATVSFTLGFFITVTLLTCR